MGRHLLWIHYILQRYTPGLDTYGTQIDYNSSLLYQLTYMTYHDIHTQLTTAEVSSLDNESLDDAMDGCVQVVEWLEGVPSLSFLSSA